MAFDLTFLWMHPLLIGAVVLLPILLAIDIGFRLGRRAAKRIDEPGRSQFTAIEGAQIGVVGLLLAFTFGMSTTRYESRRHLLIQETNAIGTAWLRAQLLSQPQRQEVETLLQGSVDVWIRLAQPGSSPAGFRAGMAEIDALHDRLWTTASAVAREHPAAVTLSLLLQSLNEMFDRKSELAAAVANRVPGIIVLLLLLGAVLSLGQVSYGCGLSGRRNLPATLMLSLLVAATIFVILDLDQPGRGLIRIDPQILSALRASMHAPAP